MEKIIIVGGVAGGMSAATRLRRLNETAEIIVLEKGPYVSFANCGLPYYVSGEIENREDLLVQTPEALKARFNLDVRPNSEVLAIETQEKQVVVKNSEDTYRLGYDKLILSPGAKPVIPQIKGITEAETVFTLRNVPDVDKLMARIESTKPKHATIVGAGFIGLEMVENLAKRGISVTLVEKAPHVLPTLDEEMAAFVQNELVQQQVEVLTNAAVVEFREAGHMLVLDTGQEVATDLVILSVGVQPESTLAAEAGLELGLRSGILVDDHYETSQKDIFAVGDAIVVKQQITGENALISLASPANRQGRQVADVIAGLPRKNQGSIGTAIVRVFAKTAASTGLNERQLKAMNRPYEIVHISGKDHAGYYPEATEINLKLLFDPNDGKIYGAQAVGTKGVDKRIDILATAIKGNLTVEDLPELEFTYAPPFGSAKDPVNMAGYAALNLIEGQSESIQWHELNEQLAAGSILLDVRNEAELKQGRFSNSLAIPLPQLRERLAELDKNQSYIISCHSGLRSYIGERILKQNGFKVKNLDGAFALYKTVRPGELI